MLGGDSTFGVETDANLAIIPARNRLPPGTPNLLQLDDVRIAQLLEPFPRLAWVACARRRRRG
jgi:hypothetical protein